MIGLIIDIGRGKSMELFIVQRNDISLDFSL